jgi:thiol-disulfide isomerase/thioredoxin
MRGTAGIIALASAVLVGAMVVLFVHFNDGGSRSGVSLGGAGKAEAACTDRSPRCLPKLTMMDVEGHDWGPRDLTGKVVVVNVWATWCAPCLREIPDFVAAKSEYEQKDVVFIGLLNDSVDDDVLASTIERMHINYPIVKMDDGLYDAYGSPNRLPTTYVYDKGGHLYFGEPGPLSRERLGAMVDNLLAQ